MFSNVNDKITELKQGIEKSKKLKLVIEDLHKEALLQEKNLLRLKGLLDKENKDVERYERLSLTKIIATFTQNIDEKISKEKQEAYSALIKYNQAKNELLYIKDEIKAKEMELNSYVDYETKLNLALDEKYNLIISSGLKDSVLIKNEINLLTDLKAKRKELLEAKDAGEKALDQIESLLESINSAKSWGVYDMIGGGIISTAIKHSHLNEAKGKINSVQSVLRKFKHELVDVKLDVNENFNLTSFDLFIDYFVDGFFSDYFVYSKIKDAKDKVDDVYNTVKSTLNKVNDSISINKNRIELANKKVTDLTSML